MCALVRALRLPGTMAVAGLYMWSSLPRERKPGTIFDHNCPLARGRWPCKSFRLQEVVRPRRSQVGLKICRGSARISARPLQELRCTCCPVTEQSRVGPLVQDRCQRIPVDGKESMDGQAQRIRRKLVFNGMQTLEVNKGGLR